MTAINSSILIELSGVKTSAQSKIHAAQQCVSNTYLSASQKCQSAKDKTIAFISDNKESIFFCGCCATTAFFSPHLFIPVAIATIIVRTELTKHLKNLAEKHLSDENNPYKPSSAFGPNYVSPMALTMGTIAALGTIFFTNLIMISGLPVLLGAIAAGDTVAKVGMDLAAR